MHAELTRYPPNSQLREVIITKKINVILYLTRSVILRLRWASQEGRNLGRFVLWASALFSDGRGFITLKSNVMLYGRKCFPHFPPLILPWHPGQTLDFGPTCFS